MPKPIAKLELFIPGKPVPKGRARASVGKNGKPFMYPDRKTAQREKVIKEYGMEFMAKRGWTEPFLGPIRMRAYFLMEKPGPASYWPGKEPTGRNTGDNDNHIKTIKDALNKVVYKDDSQIIEYSRVRKLYYDRPGVLFVLEFFDAIPKPSKRLTKKK